MGPGSALGTRRVKGYGSGTPVNGRQRPVAAPLEREAPIEHFDHQVAAPIGAAKQRPRLRSTPSRFFH